MPLSVCGHDRPHALYGPRGRSCSVTTMITMPLAEAASRSRKRRRPCCALCPRLRAFRAIAGVAGARRAPRSRAVYDTIASCAIAPSADSDSRASRKRLFAIS
ncbi:hypothetical protein C1W90_14345 [Burkholderia pseudomallei]|uniref:Uncharacterized protein n=1 Tax=Burkholderia pseudomallei TaxID=28450 RepID=A0AAX0UHH6_BURPE|nr:hypothetical protein BOC43_33715 [Burkholderia pseudomallei]MXK58837.1 hypothetical protein [Burkholderia pseudomallei]MXN58598.1 hypothetical protein [Burkholderia pseudomallei]MXP94022.1 hypothetical protein [Burkholderia pseudomallei]MXQ32378.1 hypothetical protein [Burkholderia pseudomallei]